VDHRPRSGPGPWFSLKRDADAGASRARGQAAMRMTLGVSWWRRSRSRSTSTATREDRWEPRVCDSRHAQQRRRARELIELASRRSDGFAGWPDWRFGWHGADVSVSDEIRPRTRRRQPRRLGPNLSNHVRAARAVLVKHGHSSNDALARLESPFDQFRRLTAEVSPELRTPLLIIQAFRRSNCAIGYRRRQAPGIQWTG
jgi:signal transduction histidine kinase